MGNENVSCLCYLEMLSWASLGNVPEGERGKLASMGSSLDGENLDPLESLRNISSDESRQKLIKSLMSLSQRNECHESRFAIQICLKK